MRLAAGADTRKNKYANNLQPPLHVDIMYAATVHAFCPRVLNDWTKEPSSQVRAKECDVVMRTCVPIPTPC